MSHIRVKEADGILGDKFRVLDHGYVRLIDYMGGDDRILDVAKRRYGSDLPSDRNKAMEYIVDRAINMAALGMVELKFHFEMPIAEAIDFVYEPRANVNEFSLRYSDAQDIFHNPSARDILPITGLESERIIGELAEFSRLAFERYEWARSPDVDVAKEIARATLGSNLYTRFYWKINMADFLDFVVRTFYESESNETKQYLEAAASIASRVAPLAVRTYLDDEEFKFLVEEKDPDERIEPRLQHEISAEAEALLDQPIPVLGKGYVTLVDYMGTDMSILNAARVSTGKDEKSRSEAENRGLVNYLLRHRHTTPFEMAELLWEMRLPLFVYRQGGRHRTFERVIFDAEDSHKIEFYSPKLEDIAKQSRQNHQGREEAVHEQIAVDFLKKLEENELQAMDLHSRLCNIPVPENVAKRHLPVDKFITYAFKSDLHNIMHYLGLRLDAHAQLEIREPSEAMVRSVKAVAPWSYDAFERYRLNSMSFSSDETEVLRQILTGHSFESAIPERWLRRDEDGNLRPHREREELITKLKTLGLTLEIK